MQNSDFVSALSIDKVDEQVKLFNFPDGFQVYSHSDPTETQLIYNEVVVKREYLPPKIKVDGARCIFDVGANIGIFTSFMKSLCKEATIYAFEPIEQTYSVLQRNVALHHLPDVVTYNVAIGDQDFAEKEYLYYVNLAASSTSDPLLHEPYKKTIANIFGQEQAEIIWGHTLQTVTMRTLSSIIRENKLDTIDLLKIDVEGDEYAVLQGIEQEHRSLIKQMAIEVHSPDHFTLVHSLLDDWGFTCFDTDILISEGGAGARNLFAIHNE